MKLNRPEFAKVMKEQAKHRGMEITDEQIENLANETEQVVETSVAFTSHVPIEQRISSAFTAGALFGLDGCDPQTETLHMEKKKGKDWKMKGRYPNSTKKGDTEMEKTIKEIEDMINQIDIIKQVEEIIKKNPTRELSKTLKARVTNLRLIKKGREDS